MDRSLDDLQAAIAAERRLLDRRTGEARAVAAAGKAAAEEVARLRQESETLEKAIAVLGSFAEQRQTDLQRKIETIVTHGLQTIFQEPMSLHINTTTRGKLQAADISIKTIANGQPVETPIMDARGGGVAAVAGFLLRLTFLLLHPDRRQVLLLDESFAQLSAEYEPAMAEFLRELTDKTPAQIVLVTHSEAYTEHADKAYRVSLADGATIISPI